MLKKLLKYDLKWIYSAIIVFYILALVFSVIARVCLSVENSLLFEVLGKIAQGTAISMIVSSIINCLMRSWVRFVRNVYKDESYLTHTLPVKKGTIYLSKVLASIICTFTSIIVTLIVLFICYYSKGNMEVLKELLSFAANTYNTTVINFILVISLVIFFELLFIILIGYTGIIIGHRANNGKMVKSVIVSFALYMATQLVTLGAIYIVALCNSDVMNLINTTEAISMDAVKVLMYVAIGIYGMYNLGYYMLGKHILNKGVNVD